MWKNCLMIFQEVVYIVTMYYLVLSFFGIVKRKDNKHFDPQKKFALIVAAHDEEPVVQDIIMSLKRLDYPKELYDIFVIADNCTDKTAEKAREKGALVYERFDKDKRGKGYALEWMFNKLFKMDKKYDAVIIFDADNLASKNFLKEMNIKLCEGYKVVQGYLDSKNPYDTWITGSYSIAFWTTNRMFQLARKNLHLSTQLGGTGCCIDTGLLHKLGWGATCLTEDLEFTCKLVLNGYKVGWAHEAVVYDEKPLKMKQSWRQRVRWMQGFSDVSSRYFFKLIWRGVSKLSFTAIDCALYTVQPIVTILLGVSMVISSVQYGYRVVNFFENTHINVKMASMAALNIKTLAIGAVIVGIFQLLYTPFILWLEKKLTLKIFWYYIIYPLYAVTWIPICIIGIAKKNNKEWNHTLHTRSVDITDLEKAN